MDRPYHIAIGPRLPGHGSWDWVGGSCQRILQNAGYRVTTFEREPMAADGYLMVKHLMVTEQMRDSPIWYAPIDRFGSGCEIDAQSESLFACSRILLHCEQLTKYFLPYAPVEIIEHPLNFTTSQVRTEFLTDGPVLWVGVRSNLKPVIDWLRSGQCALEVWLLSNFEHGVIPSRADLGLPADCRIHIDNWSRDRHIEWLSICRGAFDVKADDFRARYKPPAKACDFIASGLPFATTPDSSVGRYLRKLGYPVVGPNEPEIWLCEDYWQATQELRSQLLRTNSETAIGSQLRRIVDNEIRKVLATNV